MKEIFGTIEPMSWTSDPMWGSFLEEALKSKPKERVDSPCGDGERSREYYR